MKLAPWAQWNKSVSQKYYEINAPPKQVLAGDQRNSIDSSCDLGWYSVLL